MENIPVIFPPAKCRFLPSLCQNKDLLSFFSVDFVFIER